MVEITDVRRENFKKIAGTFKSQREFADALNESAGYVNQLLHGKRGIGEKAARKIEESLRMPKGSLDVYQLQADSDDMQPPLTEPVEITPEELSVINLLRDLTSAQRKRLLAYAKEFKSENRMAISELKHRYDNRAHA